MHYGIKAHQTLYNGVQYRSRLEARWAAFFDLAGWDHEYEPIDLHGWSPDFRVEFPCSHSECSGSHVLLVEVKPFFEQKQFWGLQCLKYPFGRGPNGEEIPAHASAAFGANTSITEWEMAHGSGGGSECVEFWVPEHKGLWKRAGNITQWRGPIN